ncbi:MAG: hypothetical protein LHW64_00465 [Candidatus Cloacimonetes bacterium]|nr:hypothetical protein [Candidatus Cloacimonadota bacterium]MCB5286261.1 hypothetical protein [Candidatus Cloacimonadota bacterium]MCK9184507.1 hypothetical protein [Candidatus Cloacimonadota bacterium]MCK9584079.1 hypothetical protein [Candidatus Cloacimonadota bacterium]MDY0228583.1 hypothetical protein [Candidatus Cloacimonadaceae bacterium]
MIYQLKMVDLKRTTNRKFICADDSSGVINVFTMLHEIIVARGMLILGSYGLEAVLEDALGNRFRAKCRGRACQRWIILRYSKTKTVLPIDTIPSVLSLDDFLPLTESLG